MVQRVSLINSQQTQLNSDYDFSKIVKYLLDDTKGVLFSDLSSKPEFDLDLGEGEISPGIAIIKCLRTGTTPIPNQEFYAVFQSNDTVDVDVSVGQKIFIEINNSLIQDPTLIEDTPPSTNYALGLNIGQIKSETDRPSHPNYIKLREITSGPTANDERETPKIKGDLVELTNITENIITTGDIEAGGDVYGNRFFQNTFLNPTVNNELAPKGYVDSQILIAGSVENLKDTDTYLLGEDVVVGDSLFREDMVTFAEADQVQEIGDVSANTRVSIPVFGSGTASNTLKLALRKFVSPGVNLGVRIETDSNGVPSGELVDPQAETVVLESELTTSLVDTDVPIGSNENNTHGVTLDDTTSNTEPYQGVKIKLTEQVSILNVVKNSSCTGTHAYLYSEDGVLLDKNEFSTNTAVFNFTELLNGETYYILAGAEGDEYTSVKQTGATSFPYASTRMDYESGGVVVFLSEPHGINITGTIAGEHPARGLKIQANNNIKVYDVTKSEFASPSRALIRAENGTILATANFSGDVASFGGFQLESGLFYRIECDGDGSGYNARNSGTNPTLPNLTNIRYVSGSQDGADDSRIYNITTIETSSQPVDDEDNIYNIVDITTSDTIIIPRRQKAHIVLYPGAYGSETINATNYFGVGYRLIDTTTRKYQKYDGADWANVTNPTETNSHGLSLNTTQSVSDRRGLVFQITRPGIITTAVKDGTANCTTGYIINMSGNVLATATFSGNNITFNKKLDIGTYGIVADSGGASYNSRINSSASFPYNGTYLNVTAGVHTGGISSPSSTTAVTFTDISFTANLENNFVYATSDLFTSQLLSKTDATYIYKLPVDFPRIATEAKSAGENCITIYKGLADLFSGLTQDADYYLTNTAGAIGLTAGTNVFFVGRSVNATLINVLGANVNKAITVGASPFSWVNNTGGPVQVKITGGTVNPIVINGVTVATATGHINTVPVGVTMTVTYSSAPTIVYSDI